MRAFGARIAPELRAGDVIALRGELGVGKSTLVRGIMAGMGFDGDVQSPSFAIVHSYDPPDVCVPLLHVDLYRIERPEEISELGLDDARRDSVLLVEWPERLGAQLWPDSVQLSLAFAPDGGRRLTALVPPAWEGRWPST